MIIEIHNLSFIFVRKCEFFFIKKTVLSDVIAFSADGQKLRTHWVKIQWRHTILFSTRSVWMILLK